MTTIFNTLTILFLLTLTSNLTWCGDPLLITHRRAGGREREPNLHEDHQALRGSITRLGDPTKPKQGREAKGEISNFSSPEFYPATGNLIKDKSTSMEKLDSGRPSEHPRDQCLSALLLKHLPNLKQTG